MGSCAAAKLAHYERIMVARNARRGRRFERTAFPRVRAFLGRRARRAPTAGGEAAGSLVAALTKPRTRVGFSKCADRGEARRQTVDWRLRV